MRKTLKRFLSAVLSMAIMISAASVQLIGFQPAVHAEGDSIRLSIVDGDMGMKIIRARVYSSNKKLELASVSYDIYRNDEKVLENVEKSLIVSDDQAIKTGNIQTNADGTFKEFRITVESRCPGNMAYMWDPGIYKVVVKADVDGRIITSTSEYLFEIVTIGGTISIPEGVSLPDGYNVFMNLLIVNNPYGGYMGSTSEAFRCNFVKGTAVYKINVPLLGDNVPKLEENKRYRIYYTITDSSGNWTSTPDLLQTGCWGRNGAQDSEDDSTEIDIKGMRWDSPRNDYNIRMLRAKSINIELNFPGKIPNDLHMQIEATTKADGKWVETWEGKQKETERKDNSIYYTYLFGENDWDKEFRLSYEFNSVWPYDGYAMIGWYSDSGTKLLPYDATTIVPSKIGDKTLEFDVLKSDRKLNFNISLPGILTAQKGGFELMPTVKVMGDKFNGDGYYFTQRRMKMGEGQNSMQYNLDVNSGMNHSYYAFCIPGVYNSLIIKGPEAVPMDFSDGSKKLNIDLLFDGIEVDSIMDMISSTARAAIDKELMKQALDAADPDKKGIKEIPVIVNGEEKAKNCEVTLPAEVLTESKLTKEFEIKTEDANVTLPSNMVPNVNSGKTNSLTLEINDVGEKKPAIDLKLKADGKEIPWSNSNTSVEVSIPYKPDGAEKANTEKIIVEYIDDKGSATPMPDSKFNPETKTVEFSTTHFSKYAVRYVNKTFTDLKNYSSARKQIEAVAARGIMTGINGKFNPAVGITRGDFAAILEKTLGTKTMAGLFDKKSNPKKTITEKEMYTLAAKAIAKANGLKVTVPLDKTWLIKNGYTKTTNKSTRADTAILIYNIIQKM